MIHTIYHFQYKKENHLYYPESAAIVFFPRDSRTGSKQRWKMSISVRATEGLLYVSPSGVSHEAGKEHPDSFVCIIMYFYTVVLMALYKESEAACIL